MWGSEKNCADSFLQANQQLSKKNAELESAVKNLTASLAQAKQKEDDLVEEFESTRVWNEGELSDAKDVRFACFPGCL